MHLDSPRLWDSGMKRICETMSKVTKHSRDRRIAEKLGKPVRTKPHFHLTMKKLGMIPSGTNRAVNIKVAKRGN